MPSVPAPALNTFQLIWADSEVTGVALADDGLLTLSFAAAHVQQVGVCLNDALGYLPGVVLRCEGVKPRPPGLTDALGRLAEGRWLVNGQPMRAWTLGTPLQGALRLQLRFANGCEIDVAATHAHAECPPGAAFRPSLAC